VGYLGISEKGYVTMKLFSSPQRLTAGAVFVLLFLCLKVMVQGDPLSKISGITQGDSVSKNSGTAQGDSLEKNKTIAKKDTLSKTSGIAQGDSVSKSSGTAQGDSLSKKTTMAQKDSLSKSSGIDNSGLANIVPGNKKIRAYGWGEYRVGGRCLCCDNMNDGDCIVVHTIERTDRERITQIVDGKIEGDTGDNTTYFGDLRKRDLPEPVNLIMVEMSLGKMYEIRKVVVYTMMDKEKRTNFLSNCELGYYDQFNRLQWTGKVESKKYDEPMTFKMENPVFTKAIMLRVKGGKSRITEVAVFGGNK
jgi:hypothetical protein